MFLPCTQNDLSSGSYAVNDAAMAKLDASCGETATGAGLSEDTVRVDIREDK